MSALVFGALIFGYMKGKEGSKVAIANYAAQAEKKISELKDMNAAISNKVTVQYVDRVKTIKEKEIRYVDLATNTVPSQFELSNGWVYTHDTGASGGDADATRSSDETPSGIKDNEGLVTVLHNYSICEQNANQVKSLQDWINENKKATDDSNNNVKPKKKFGIF